MLSCQPGAGAAMFSVYQTATAAPPQETGATF
jgi:hypothetical protein